MAKPCTRTYCDDVTDALALLDTIDRELPNWRAHLNAITEDPGYGRGLQAQRCGKIIQEAVNTALCDTIRASGQLLPRL